MQLAVLLGLAALWVAVLLPDFLRRRTTRRAGDSISNFSRHLSVLERSNPIGSRRAARSRRAVLSPPVPPLVPPRPARVTTPRPSASNVVPIAARAQTRQAEQRRPQSRPQHARTAHPGVPTRPGRPVASTRPAAPARRSSAHQRRQDVIVGLSAAGLLSLLATVAFGGVMVYLFLLVAVLFVAYLGLVLFSTNRSSGPAATSAKGGVTYLTPARSQRIAPVPAHSQRSSAAR